MERLRHMKEMLVGCIEGQMSHLDKVQLACIHFKIPFEDVSTRTRCGEFQHQLI